MQKSGLLILSRAEIAGLMSIDDYVNAVESAFSLLASRQILGAGILDIPGIDGMFHVKGSAMPLEKTIYVAVKVNGNFPENRNRYGLPTIQGAILLCDGTRGFPLALMDSTEITIQRTAAATAIAARHLARPDAKIATICGCGVQAPLQLMALKHTLPIERVFAFDRDQALCESYSVQMEKEIGIPVTPASDLEIAISQSDVIVTCTTSREYFLKKEYVPAGAFVAAVGADSHDKQEIDPALMASATVVVDVLDQCRRIGDLHHAIEGGLMKQEDVYGELHEVISGAIPGRVTENEIIVFDSTGTAIQDVASAALVYERAIRKNIGTTIDLFR